MGYVKYDVQKQKLTQKVRTPDGKEQEVDFGEMMIAVGSCSKCGRTLVSQGGMIGSILQKIVGEKDFLCECGEICHSMPVIDVKEEKTNEQSRPEDNGVREDADNQNID